MAVATFMHWRDVSPRQYDSVMVRLGLDADPAAGAVLHIASFTDDGLEVCDIWQTEQAFQGFLARRLLPAAEEVGIDTEPEVKLVQLHNLFAADPLVIDRIGALSIPAAVAAWAA